MCQKHRRFFRPYGTYRGFWHFAPRLKSWATAFCLYEALKTHATKISLHSAKVLRFYKGLCALLSGFLYVDADLLASKIVNFDGLHLIAKLLLKLSRKLRFYIMEGKLLF